MTNFTYEPPESKKFIHSLIKYFRQKYKDELAALLTYSSYEVFSTGRFSNIRWNEYDAILKFYVPIDYIQKFTEQIKKDLLDSSRQFFPSEVGYFISDLEIIPMLEAPPDDESSLSNSASLVSTGTIEHDGLRFRSSTEIKVYKALEKRNVLLFPNATAVLGGKGVKREPDSLVCQNGKWGILEVMGDQYHSSNTAMRDHNRARLFKDYGLFCIEFYDATRCYEKPDEVVDNFLEILSKATS
ncbi:hypothetical protein IQ247_14315 [Plectonema cf. radiosum LEGE 06105]|uniref:DUF559 domain-containing protein n=1 Tax=Plectonema cf. radiosum LEGE 06105 TaxID=945769 RepID=A0A8J7JTK3_9CYAN|nr:hypothetical protein [Plectonema radiosum]MBE9213824.1 hypothetical protein [Plectonema cf. radiosum LEGE 06105]